MTTTRKRISIYDYPEHLNPFSEDTRNFTMPERHKIIVDKYRHKNSTWSSKISKKLNRSVSWLEKSWLANDNSPRRTYESKICKELQNNALYAKQNQTHNLIRRESCTDVRHDTNPFNEQTVVNGNSFGKSISVENLHKCDAKKRKKRPAPLPPSSNNRLSTVVNDNPGKAAPIMDNKNSELEAVPNEDNEPKENSSNNETVSEILNNGNEQNSVPIEERSIVNDDVLEQVIDESKDERVEEDLKNLTIEEYVEVEIKTEQPTSLDNQSNQTEMTKSIEKECSKEHQVAEEVISKPQHTEVPQDMSKETKDQEIHKSEKTEPEERLV